MRLRFFRPDEIRVRLTQFARIRLERAGLGQTARRDRALSPANRSRTPREILAWRQAGQGLVPLVTPEVAHEAATVAGRTGSQELLQKADALARGEFDVLGRRGLDFGRPIDWHFEPTSHRTTPKVHWSRIAYLDPSIAGDKKFTWELNRHQYFMTLGRAYLRSGDERYAQTFVEHLTSWMDENPPKRGINWASSLEMAFRSISWAWALEFFRCSPALTPTLFDRILLFVDRHGRHIEQFLSTYFSPNTHLTGEALGLIYLGDRFPELTESERWKRRGLRILLDQLPRHVRHDGVYFEQSTWYHRYTTDFYLHLLALARRARFQLPDMVREKVWSLVDHMVWMTRPDGTFPLVGDDDGGRLLALDETALDDWRSTLSTAAVLLDRGDCKFVAGRLAEETIWLLGCDAVARFEALQPKPPHPPSRAFPAGGYYTMRSGWSPEADWAVVDCGPHGTMTCGHAHADALSIELVIRGLPWIIDPGTFTYTGSRELRNYFRSSQAHNTVSVDGESSSVPAGPFSWRQVAGSTARTWLSTDRFDFFEGSHDGYTHLKSPVVHDRAVLHLRGDYWIVRDRLRTTGIHEYQSFLHFSPDVHLVVERSRRALVARRGESVGVVLVQAFGSAQTWSVADDWVAPLYGNRIRAQTGRLEWEGDGPQEVLMLIRQADASDDSVLAIEQSVPGGGLVVRCTPVPTASDFIVSGAARIERYDVQTEGNLAWIRMDEEGRSLHAIAVGAQSIRLGHLLGVTLTSPASYLVIRVTPERAEVDLSLQAGRIRFEGGAGPLPLMVNGRMRTLDRAATLELDASEV